MCAKDEDFLFLPSWAEGAHSVFWGNRPMSNQTAKTDDSGKARRAELTLLRTLPELLTHHLEKRPDAPLYKYYDNMTKDWIVLTVRDVVEKVTAWRRAFAKMDLKRGDRVAMLLPNCIEAIFFDQAALANALVPVPLHAIDTPGSSAYILNDSETKVLFTNRLAKWKGIRETGALPALKTVVITDEATDPYKEDSGITVTNVDAWLAAGENLNTADLPAGPEPEDLAAIVYTSGTTGNPKGVMLTHRAILANVTGVLTIIWPEADDVWLSFLPLSHTFERTTTYYTALGMGNLVAFNRSIGFLQDDMRLIRPTVMMSVPRIYEKVYAKVQDRLTLKSPAVRFLMRWAVEVGYRKFCKENGLPLPFTASQLLDGFVSGFLDHFVAQTVRNIFGGRPKLFIAGGAALSPAVAKFFLGLGVPIYQGYGMTETSPIISVNPVGKNHPTTVGVALKNIRVRLGENDELEVLGPTLMKGYWKREKETAAMFTSDGWLKTGDQADIYEDGDIRLKGRIKEIIVTSTGEKIPPADLENAIVADNLFSQVMVLGDNRPYISALAVVNPEQWPHFCETLHADPKDPATLENRDVRNAALRRIKAATANFPNYGIPRNVRLIKDPWTIENGMLTPTLKLKRRIIRAKYAKEIEALYGDVRSQR